MAASCKSGIALAEKWRASSQDSRGAAVPTLFHPGGIASDNRFTVRAQAYIIPGPCAHHVSVLREQYL